MLRRQHVVGLDIGITTAYVSSDLALPQNDNNSFGILPSGLLGSADSTSNGGYGFLTPQQAEKVEAGQRIERFTGGLNINFRPWSFLTVRGTAGYDVTNQSDRFLTPPNEIPFDLDGTAFRYGAQIRACGGARRCAGRCTQSGLRYPKTAENRQKRGPSPTIA